jgi:hypothetical protein
MEAGCPGALGRAPPAEGQTIAEAKQIQPKRSAVPARVVVDHRKVEPMSEDEHCRRGEAPDRLWQEIKRAVAESSSKP